MSKFLLPTKVQFTCLALQESRAMYVPDPETWLISDILNSNLYFLEPKSRARSRSAVPAEKKTSNELFLKILDVLTFLTLI